jgi:hypothetical protein
LSEPALEEPKTAAKFKGPLIHFILKMRDVSRELYSAKMTSRGYNLNIYLHASLRNLKTARGFRILYLTKRNCSTVSSSGKDCELTQESSHIVHTRLELEVIAINGRGLRLKIRHRKWAMKAGKVL